MDNEIKILIAQEHLKELQSFFLAHIPILKKAFQYRYIQDWVHIKEYWNDVFKSAKKGLEKHYTDEFEIKKVKNEIDVEMKERPDLIFREKDPNKLKAFQEEWKDKYIEVQDFLTTEDQYYNEGVLRGWYDEVDIQAQTGETRLSKTKKTFTELASIIKDPAFLDKMLTEKKTLKETLSNNIRIQRILKEYPDMEEIVNSFSEAMNYTLSSGRIRNPQLGEDNKKRSNDFAKSMNESLKNVRQEGFKSTRKIADRFNELGIKSSRGGEWSHNTVSRLIVKRRELGLEDQEGNELTAG